MLSHLCLLGCSSASSPAVYTPPVSPTDPSLFTSHPHLPPPSLPQSLMQRRHGSNKLLGLCSSMREHWTYPSSLLSASSPPINLPPHNTTLPLPTASSTMSHPTPTHNKTIHLSSMDLILGLYRRQLPVPTKVGQCGWLLGWAWRPPTLPSQPTPRKPQTKLERQTVPCQCLPPSTIPLRPCFPYLHHPQRTPTRLLPAHTCGGSVCGRGGVCYRFWR
jgi:hypothetical protein